MTKRKNPEPDQSPSSVLAQPLALPCGRKIPNRIMKSATSEALGDRRNRPKMGLVRLYRTLSQGGAGLIVTGNVMLDHRRLGEPRNVVVEDESDLPLLSQWAAAGTSAGGELWMQINHPGRQVPRGLSSETVAPSAVAFTPAMRRFFATPRELRPDEIEDIIARFCRTANIAKKAGFTGVQVHGAHGYLVSQFLSPRTNIRTDQWGGSIENRMRFLLRICDGLRAALGSGFPVAVKLNSADFQHGGFSDQDAVIVAQALEKQGVDLLEISGGSYESPAMTGRLTPGKDRDREAYFLDFAQRLRSSISIPLALTGGFRTARGMAAAVSSGAIDMAGVARPLCVDPDMPRKIFSGLDYESPVEPIRTGIKALDRAAMMEVSWYELQLARMAKGKAPNVNENPWLGLTKIIARSGLHAFSLRRARD
ncbi:MAG: NADH:flavin oxidoreductase/NADH oxidase family protein [Thermodesulfobacteriota bacterium]